MSILMRRPPAINPGTKFNSWTVLGVCFRVRHGTHPETCCVAACDCGTVGVVHLRQLQQGRSRNCGCVRAVTLPASTRTHGKSMTHLYRAWKGMRERCQNPAHIGFKSYGASGVTVCPEWDADYEIFERWALVNGWQQGLQIDRVDSNGPYAPGNCRITTNQENCNNKRRHVRLTIWGESRTIYHWSQDPRCVVSHATLRGRIKGGWDAEQALITPREVLPSQSITAFGETKTVADWAKDARCVVRGTTLYMRLLKYGWEAGEAITTPARP